MGFLHLRAAPLSRRVRSVEGFYHLVPQAAAEFISLTDERGNAM
jgi:hypothetical protein